MNTNFNADSAMNNDCNLQEDLFDEDKLNRALRLGFNIFLQMDNKGWSARRQQRIMDVISMNILDQFMLCFKFMLIL